MFHHQLVMEHCQWQCSITNLWWNIAIGNVPSQTHPLKNIRCFSTRVRNNQHIQIKCVSVYEYSPKYLWFVSENYTPRPHKYIWNVWLFRSFGWDHLAEITWLGSIDRVAQLIRPRSLGWDQWAEITWLRPHGWDHLADTTWMRSLGWEHLAEITWLSSFGWDYLAEVIIHISCGWGIMDESWMSPDESWGGILEESWRNPGGVLDKSWRRIGGILMNHGGILEESWRNHEEPIGIHSLWHPPTSLQTLFQLFSWVLWGSSGCSWGGIHKNP